MYLLLLLLLQGSPDLDRWIERLDADAIEVREEAERRLTEAGAQARPLLLRVAGGSNERALRAKRLLRWLEYAAVLPPVALAQVPSLRDDLLNEDPAVRRTALFEALGKVLGLPPAVMTVALDDPDPTLRLEAAVRLLHDPDGRAGAMALDFLRRWDAHDYERVRQKDLERFVHDARNRVVRTGRARTEEILPLLSSEKTLVRTAGLELLTELNRWEAFPHVQEMLGRKHCVEKAIRFLEAAGHPPDAATCLELVRHFDGPSAGEAARALERMEACEAVPELLRLLPEKEMAGWQILEVAAALDPAAAEPAATKIVDECLKSQVETRMMALVAIRILIRSEKPEHFDRILSGLRKIASANRNDTFFWWDFQGLDKPFARCIPPGRIDTLLDLCPPRSESYSSTGSSANDHLGFVASGALKHLDRRLVVETCMGRVLDAQAGEGKRIAAAQALTSRLAVEDLATILPIIRDLTAMPALRRALFKALPWQEPGPMKAVLRDLAEEFLKKRDEGFLNDVMMSLVYSSEPEFPRMLLRELISDDRLPPPQYGYRDGSLPQVEGVGALIEKRLASSDPAVVLSIIGAARCGEIHGHERQLGPLLGSKDPSVRSAVAELMAYYPDESHRPALRRAVREEEDLGILARDLEAIRLLRDRPALEAALARDVPKGTPADEARIRSILAVGTKEEILALEGRLKDLPGPLLCETLEALAQKSADVARRFVPWAMRSVMPAVRRGAATAIGLARLEEHLPDLSLMAITEVDEVRNAALRALHSFDRKAWIPVYRNAIRFGDYLTVYAMSGALNDTGAPELAPELIERISASGIEGASAAHALDVCLHPKARRAWSGLVFKEAPQTPEQLVSNLESMGVRTRLSEGAKGQAGRILKRWLNAEWTAGTFLSTIYTTPKDSDWKQSWLAVISEEEGLRIVTLEESRAYWIQELRK
jgi:HEAT repeat protein